MQQHAAFGGRTAGAALPRARVSDVSLLSITAALPEGRTDCSPIVLVHGAANSALVWKYWQRELAALRWPSYAVDLRGHGGSDPLDLSGTTMADYADDVSMAMAQVARTPVLMGWSMGGLVAMMVAGRREVAACVSLAPSVPARARDGGLELREGEFGPEEYGVTSLDPDAAQPWMEDLDREERVVALASLCRESRLARDERKAGVVIESLPCPLLVVTGTADIQWPRDRYEDLWLPADHLVADGASHWGLVLSRRALSSLVPAVCAWFDERADV